jgi:hypothetical protein
MIEHVKILDWPYGDAELGTDIVEGSLVELVPDTRLIGEKAGEE